MLYSRTDFDDSPMLVFYEVTRACDLVCQHCRACAQAQPDPNELSIDQSRQLIDQLTEFPKPPMLVLTGGDPLKRADLFELVEHAIGRSLEVSVTPSATPLVTTAALKRLQDAGISRLGISLDGADAATHDAVRGVVGSFDRTREIINDANDLGIPVQVNTTITLGNLDQIDRMADLLAENRIVLWSVFFLVPVGRAAESLRMSGRQYESAFERLWLQSKRGRFGIKTTAAPHYRRYLLQRLKLQKTSIAGRPASMMRQRAPLGVNDGKGVMFVSHDGRIYPSGFMPIECGRFPDDNPVSVYQSSDLFLGLRDASRLEGKCGECQYKEICGGSRARAFATTKNPYASEPDCIYEPPTSGL